MEHWNKNIRIYEKNTHLKENKNGMGQNRQQTVPLKPIIFLTQSKNKLKIKLIQTKYSKVKNKKLNLVVLHFQFLAIFYFN